MIFEQLNPHACKTYLLGNQKTGAVILVDPVIDHFPEYLSLLEKRKYTLTHVIDTHTHADHISAGSALRDKTGCEYVMHEHAPPKCVTMRVHDGDVLRLNGFEIRIIHTPGHTKDSMSLIIGDLFLTGDALFLEDAGAGRDDLPGGDPGMHWESLERIKRLPEKLVVYPAHEYRNREPSDLARQKATNPHLALRTRDEFVKYLNDLRLGPAEWMKDVLKANYACARDPKAAWIPVDTPACEIKGTLEKGVNEVTVRYITVPAFKELIKKSPPPSAPVLLDVREKAELKDQLGALDGIINIPIAQLTAQLPRLAEIKEKNIVVICRSGGRATTAAQILQAAGFFNVSVLEGGMIAYRRGRG